MCRGERRILEVRVVFNLIPARMQLLARVPRKAAAQVFPAATELLAAVLRVDVEARGCDADQAHLPIGVQVHGNFAAEDVLIQVAAQIERAKPAWFGATPGVHVSK